MNFSLCANMSGFCSDSHIFILLMNPSGYHSESHTYSIIFTHTWYNDFLEMLLLTACTYIAIQLVHFLVNYIPVYGQIKGKNRTIL